MEGESEVVGVVFIPNNEYYFPILFVGDNSQVVEFAKQGLHFPNTCEGCLGFAANFYPV